MVDRKFNRKSGKKKSKNNFCENQYENYKDILTFKREVKQYVFQLFTFFDKFSRKI